MATPKIRLKGFEGEWKDTIVSDICKIGTGKSNTQDQVEDGKYPFFIRSDKVVKSKKFLYDCEAVITVGDGQIGRVFHYINGKFDLHQRCYKMTDFKLVKAKYFYYYFSAFFYARAIKMSAKATVDSLRKDMIADMPICYPVTKSEQSAIASYFQSLDNLIQTTEKKIECLKQMKAASLISMFPQEGETTPKVRFKGFEGEWKKVKLNSIAKRITRKNTNLESTLPLTISSQYGLIEQTAFFNNVVASSNLSGYYLLKKGEFAYNKSYSNGYPFGSVKRLDKYDMGVLSTLYIVFSIDTHVSSDYIVYFFDTDLWHKEVAMRAAEGARNHGLLNIGAEDFLDIDIMIPLDVNEQKQIADYFTNLDTQISLHAQRLEKLKNIKAECLNKMFV